MERTAVFVDAGYLLAEGGRLVCGTAGRPNFDCGFRGLTTALADWVADHSEIPALRTYWYDGAPGGVPTPDHERIGGLPYVKVRLGRIIQGEQKGVDALIYRDLMTLARERAMARAYLLSGDEDLREGVVAAQDMGVQVVLIGVPAGQRSNQSAALIREADEHVVLPKAFWDPHFKRRASAIGPSGKRSTTTSAQAQATGAKFARAWIARTSEEHVAVVLEASPRVPRDLDVQLLLDAERALGPLRDRQDLRRAVREAFWVELRESVGRRSCDAALAISADV